MLSLYPDSSSTLGSTASIIIAITSTLTAGDDAADLRQRPASTSQLLLTSVPSLCRSHTLRSSGSNLLFAPRVHTGFGSRSFSVAAPVIWNSLPLDIRNSCTISCFCRQLKTLFYKAAFRPPSCPIPSQPRAQRLRFGWLIVDIVCFTN